LRNPEATRPWQHVLEPLSGYLGYVALLAGEADVPSALNFGPAADDVLTVAEVAETMLVAMNSTQRWVTAAEPQPEEAQFLTIDPALATSSIGWRPRLNASEALQWTAEWYQAVANGADPRQATLKQIHRYEALS
jgi:CDP-glucose 4,6-dehydratase